MYEVSQEFRTALESGAIQKIKGTVIDSVGGTYFTLDDDNISKPQFTRQCTTQSDSFNFGQLYASTVSVKVLNKPELLRTNLRGCKLTLQFGLEGSNEWVPLGVWNITEPQRDSQNSITIKGIDNTSKLDVPIPYKENNMSSFSRRMETITELTGVEFKQTAQEIFALAGITRNPNGVWAQGYCNTCREELIAMAQYTGLLVYIDRDGDIFLRKFGDAQLPTAIQASRRQKADLAEYTMCVAALAYTCGGRYRDTAVFYADDITHANTDLCLYFADNPYMKLGKAEDAEDYVKIAVNNLADCGIWVPGTFDFYGDPTIDLGDIVTVSGGINGVNGSCAFLVTGFNWQFRGPMTLISAGAAEAVGNVSSSSGSGSSSSGGGGGQTVAQKPWEMVDLEGFPQTLTVRWREIGATAFAVADETLVIAHLTVNLIGTDVGEVVVHVLLDGVMQTEYSWDTIANGQKLTTELNVPLTVEGGVHRLTIEAKGAATVDRIVASVYGQGVSEYTGEPTFESEYRYHADTVDAYIGSALAPRIPAQLGGNDIHVIGGGSFAGSDVEYAYIPDGVEEIK
jgi:hypothetical protein